MSGIRFSQKSIFVLVLMLAASANAGPLQPRFDINAAKEILTAPAQTSRTARENFESLVLTSVFPELPILRNLYAAIGTDSHDPFWSEFSSVKFEIREKTILIGGEDVNPNALSALWKLIPERFYSSGIMYQKNCQDAAPLLALLVAFGARLESQNYQIWNFQRKDFAAWVELYLTLGHRLEMQGGGDLIGEGKPNFDNGVGACDAALSYMQWLMPGLKGLPWPKYTIIMHLPGYSTFLVSAPKAGKDYSAEFRFQRQFTRDFGLPKAKFRRFRRAQE